MWRAAGTCTDRALLQKLKGEKQKSAKETGFSMNKPFPNYFQPHFQNDSWCLSFHMTIRFHLNSNLTHFHTNGRASGLVFKTRVKVIRNGLLWVSCSESKVAKENFLLQNILCMRGGPACARLLLPIQFEKKLSKFSALSSHMINYLITEFS